MTPLAFLACLLPVLLVLLLWSRTSTHLRQVGAPSYRGTPVWLLPIVVTGGAIGGLGVALLGIRFRHALGLAGAAEQEHLLPLLLTVGIDVVAEEIGKVLVLGVLIAAGRVQDRLRVLLMGLLAGASFACVENLLFLTVASGEVPGGRDPGALMLARLPVSTLLHPAASAMMASALWWLIRERTSGAALLQAFVVAWMACVLHGAWNLSLFLSDGGHTPLLALAGLLVPLGAGLVVGLDLARLTRHTRKLLARNRAGDPTSGAS